MENQKLLGIGKGNFFNPYPNSNYVAGIDCATSKSESCLALFMKKGNKIMAIPYNLKEGKSAYTNESTTKK